jgi:hypothetical protein
MVKGTFGNGHDDEVERRAASIIPVFEQHKSLQVGEVRDAMVVDAVVAPTNSTTTTTLMHIAYTAALAGVV